MARFGEHVFPTSSTRHPLLWAAVAFATGIVAGVRLWRPALWWVVAFALFVLAAAWFRSLEPWRGRVASVLALAATAALGAWCVQARDANAGLPDVSKFSEKEVVVTAHVTRDGILRGRGAGARQSLDIETEEIAADGVVTRVAAGVRLTIYSRIAETAEEEADGDVFAPLPNVFTYGQRLRFAVKLRLPRNFGNPGAWDYRGYLAGQGIVGLGAVASDKVGLLPGLGGSRFGRWRSRARRSVLAHIHQLWPRDEAGLFDAMLIGERSFIGRDTTTGWQRTGIYHILVVSGMNVGILAFVIFWTLRRLRAGQGLASALTILASAGYAYLADLGAPVMRSVLMLAVYLCARLLYRERAPLNAVGGAALALLAVDPRALFDASFQLTFLAVAAIAGIAVPILERTSGPYRHALRFLDSGSYDLSLPPQLVQFRLDLRMIAARVARLVLLPSRFAAWRSRAAQWAVASVVRVALATYEVIAVSALMQIALALPMAYYFHRATIVGLPANTVAVPLTGVLMPASALALALSYAWLPLAQFPAAVAAWSLKGITWTVAVLGSWRSADVRVATPTLAPSVVAAVAFAVAIVLVRRRALAAGIGLAALLASAAWLTAVPPRPQVRAGALEVTAIDVGEAESLLVISPEGRTLLVDAAGALGPWQTEFDFGEDVVSPYLWARGITRLDAVAVTHPHADHAGGMRAVIANFRPRELWVGPMEITELVRRTFLEASARGTAVVHRAAGDEFRFGSVQVRVLAPRAGAMSSVRRKNDDSLVMKITYGNTSALLEGDAEKVVEHYLVSAGPGADLLKVAHHGSRTSTIPELLQAVHPRLAVISAGAHNRFGHPRPEVLQRLAGAQVATFRTDTLGAMTFYLDGSTVEARPAVPR